MDHLSQCAAGRSFEGQSGGVAQCQTYCQRLGGGEVEWRERVLGIDRVAAVAAVCRPDRNAAFLQCEQVAFDRSLAYLELVRQPSRRQRVGDGGSQLLDKRIETVGSIHYTSCPVVARPDDLDRFAVI